MGRPSSALAAPLTTVPYVDLTRYAGKWYEIAAIPQYFQRNCASDTTADYEVLDKNRMRVYNSCTSADHRRIASEGRAKVVDTQSNAKLKVTFAHIGRNYFYTFGGKYWVIYLDANYRIAMIGHPNRKYGWILSRDPHISERTMEELASVLKRKGYDTCQFLITPQKNGLKMKSRLCDTVSLDTLESQRL